MERREFVRVGTGIGVAALAGCATLTGDSPESTPTGLTIHRVTHPDEIPYNGTATVRVELSNPGEEVDEETIVVEYAGESIGSDTLALHGNQSTTTSFEIDGTDFPAGTSHDLTVTTSEDSYTATIPVESEPAPPQFEIQDVSHPASIGYDESFTVTVTVRNTGGQAGETDVTVKIGEQFTDTATVTVSRETPEAVEIAISGDQVTGGGFLEQTTITATAGTDTSESTISIESANPWGKETVTVGLEQRVPARHDIHEIVRNALSYWEQNSREFTGHEITYEYQANTTNPDVQIVLVENILQCGEHTGEIAGCAPLITTVAPDTAEIRIVDGYRADWMETTLKHEIGHTLGLGHDDEPAHIMSNEIEDRIPDYQDRRDAIDSYNNSTFSYSLATTSWGNALDAWENRDFTTAADHAERARDTWETARNRIGDARRTADRLNEVKAERLLDSAYQHTDYLRRSADAAVDMAEAADRGDYDTSDTYREQSNEYREDALTYDYADPEDIILAFGFPVKN